MTCSLRRSLLVLPLLAAARAAEPAAPAGTPPVFPLEAYAAVGSNFAQNTRLGDLGWTEAQFDSFVEGMRATFHGKPLAFDAQARLLHEGIARRLQSLSVEAERPPEKFTGPGGIEDYMKAVTKSFKLQRSDSGLAFGLIPRGTGSRPGPDDTVVISYNVIAADAKTELPSISVQQQRLKVSELLPGLAEGVQMMPGEGSALLVLPPDLSYGDGTWPAGVERGSPLIFTVVLHAVMVAP